MRYSLPCKQLGKTSRNKINSFYQDKTISFYNIKELESHTVVPTIMDLKPPTKQTKVTYRSQSENTISWITGAYLVTCRLFLHVFDSLLLMRGKTTTR